MSELSLLLPDPAALPEVPTLARWLARGDRLTPAKPGREAALRSCFEFLGADFPHAALSRSLDAGDAAGYLWLRADPAYVIADAVTVRLLACGELGLSAEESAELARPLRLLFGDAGFPLEPATPARWYLRCPPGARLPRFAAPAEALGDDLGRHLPSGENERQWRHLLNEAQVILHNHPVNARRIARGRIPANSLWFWGAGRLPDWVRTKFTRVLSADRDAIALARLAGVPVGDTTPREFAAEDGASILLDLAAPDDGAALARDWIAAIERALATRRLDCVMLLLPDGGRIRFRRAHRWRFWRRIGTLAG
jgi:hypothetical protein